MRCSSVVEGKYTAGAPEIVGQKYNEQVRLDAVYGKDGSSNASWAKATPSGSVTLTIDNPAAWGHFKEGGFYFVDFFETTEEG